MLLTENIIDSCGYAMGGIKRLWLANWAETRDSIRFTGENFQIVSEIQPLEWLEFQLNGQVTLFNEDLALSAYGKVYNQTINLSFEKMEWEKREAIDQLIKGRYICIYLDQNDNYWIFGLQRPIKITASNIKSDIKGGTNGYLLNFATTSTETIKEIHYDYIEEYVLLLNFVCPTKDTIMFENEDIRIFSLSEDCVINLA